MIISELKFDECLDLYAKLLKIKIPNKCRSFVTKDNVYYIYFYDKNDVLYDNFVLNDECTLYVMNYYLQQCKISCVKEIAFNV